MVAAQRWWIGDGVDEWLRDYPERALWRELLTNPTIWAGYRFVGVCERRPERRVERPTPLSASDEANVEAVIASLDEHGEDLSDIIERELDELDDALADGVPTPAQSQRASQLYRARVLSSYGHNQLCALAWLHEGIRIATPASRGALVRDAARLWLWFALRETPEALYIGAQGPTPERAAARGRAAQLLGELPPADYVAEWGMLEVLAAAEQREPAALGRAVETVCAALELAAPRLDLGALAIACLVAAMDVKAAGRHAAEAGGLEVLAGIYRDGPPRSAHYQHQPDRRRSTSPLVSRLATVGSGDELNLNLKRKNVTVSVEKWLSKSLQFEASFKNEDKNGARLFGNGFNCPSGAAPAPTCTTAATGINQWALLMLPEPINSTTKQFDARLNYSNDKLLLSGGYYGSFYNNEYTSMSATVDGNLNNPLGAPMGGAGLSSGWRNPAASHRLAAGQSGSPGFPVRQLRLHADDPGKLQVRLFPRLADGQLFEFWQCAQWADQPRWIH